AGDGTTTSILLADNLIRGGFRLIDNGLNNMDMRRGLERVAKDLSKEIDSRKIPVKSDKDLEYVARVSANNDKEIAEHVVRVVNISGQDGLVFIEPNSRPETEIIEEAGFT